MDTRRTPFSVRTTPGTGSQQPTVSLHGDVGEQALPELRAALAPLETGGGTLNLTAVTFLPSRSLGVVLAARRKALEAGHDLRLVAAEYTIASSILRVTSVPHDHA